MSSDTEQFAPPPTEVPPAPPGPMALEPMPASFAFGGSSGPRGSTRLLAVVGAVVVAAAAYGAYTTFGGSAEPEAAPPATVVAKPKPKAKPALTSDSKVIGSVLKNMATAEESYGMDNDGKYTAKMADLVAEGFVADPRVNAKIVSAGAGAYCLRAAGAPGAVFYYSSRSGRMSRTACR